tara:strand:- start:320 stop:553 length:234 start_codon:yes stop_codon:yes gene_type:complete
LATYTVVNATLSQLANINAGGTDVDAQTYKDGITLTNAELAAVCSTQGVYATSDLTAVADAVQLKRILGVASQYVST